MERARPLRLLLDEHYPGWLAEELTKSGIDAEAVVVREDLRGSDDTAVLRTAAAEDRVVVTEDVTTFSIAIASIQDHTGVVYCHHSRFPRTRTGLNRLARALRDFATEPPPAAHNPSFIWWLSR
ncbi:DUF5615 family PIN-like protein [uncultured Agrococcus sp.]|uniref:DUF5615 family PIN-like protein n=1 Tax=uncultured Agrococcus sp. TaxID=382258 RepID=UPI0025E6256F|nr:DUF5615 family PIN-like protein [uncultured Agrococcus sp.]